MSIRRIRIACKKVIVRGLSLPRRWRYVTLVYVLTFAVVLPIVWHDRPHSLYFFSDPKHLGYVELARLLNAGRLVGARQYLSEHPHPEVPERQDVEAGHSSIPPRPQLDIVMVSKDRVEAGYRPYYWLQTGAQLHQQIHASTRAYFNVTSFFICNVDDTQDSRRDYINQINRTIELRFRFNAAGKRRWRNRYAKAKDDYAFCVLEAVNNSSEYVLVLEDDALIKPGFFQQLYRHLHTSLAVRAERRTEGDRWAFIKLYYPEKWLGYSWEWQHVTELLGIMLCTGSTAAACSLFLITARGVTVTTHRSSHLQPSATHCFLVTAVYCVCVCVCVGRAYIVELLPARLLLAKECCVPAVLYRASVLPELAHNLTQTTFNETRHDVLIDRWAAWKGLTTYVAQPNMIKHLGLVSTQNKNAKKGVDFIR